MVVTRKPSFYSSRQTRQTGVANQRQRSSRRQRDAHPGSIAIGAALRGGALCIDGVKAGLIADHARMRVADPLVGRSDL
jgi:hypothetical protein